MDAHISLSVCRGQRPDTRRIPDGCPKRLSALIELCWKQEPSKRPPFAGIESKIIEIVFAIQCDEKKKFFLFKENYPGNVIANIKL